MVKFSNWVVAVVVLLTKGCNESNEFFLACRDELEIENEKVEESILTFAEVKNQKTYNITHEKD